MNCEAKGIPKPDYYWYKDGQKIFDDDNRSPMVGLENALNFQGSLLLQKVAWKDRNCFKLTLNSTRKIFFTVFHCVSSGPDKVVKGLMTFRTGFLRNNRIMSK